jgi:hypothetical protein
MAQLVRRALFDLAPKARWTDRARRAAGVLKSFHMTVSPDGTLSAGLDVDAEEGQGDTGQLREDLTDVMVALGEAAQDHGRGVVFLFDEVQCRVALCATSGTAASCLSSRWRCRVVNLPTSIRKPSEASCIADMQHS